VEALTDALARQDGPVVFVSVLMQQLGVPVPAEPTLILAGSAVAWHLLPLGRALAGALLAVFLVDSVWFAIGRRYGGRVLGRICRLSRAPDRWIQRTEGLLRRRGLKSVALIKFIPGLPMLAPLYAGTMKARYRSFLLYDLGATLVWASSAVGIGGIFRRQVGTVLAALARLGLPVAIAALLGVAAAGVWKRRTPRRSPAAFRSFRPRPTA
jgi:membrane protein DedA with SNARE-associated domain